MTLKQIGFWIRHPCSKDHRDSSCISGALTVGGFEIGTPED